MQQKIERVPANLCATPFNKTIEKQKIIDKYINRIKIDYPEDDKLMMDLLQFESELAALEQENVCDNFDPEIGFPTGNGKCKTCGKYHDEPFESKEPILLRNIFDSERIAIMKKYRITEEDATEFINAFKK